MPEETSPRQTIFAFVVVALFLAVGVFVVYTTRPTPVEIVIMPPVPTATPAPSATPAPITVYITGAVATPEQLIVIAHGSRVQEAIEQAGGMTENADPSRVNLAMVLRDGDQVHVPTRTTESDVSTDLLPTASVPRAINVNTATLEELMALPNIGASTAQAIIDYREVNGAFTRLEDLDNVRGVGAKTLEDLAPLITFTD